MNYFLFLFTLRLLTKNNNEKRKDESFHIYVLRNLSVSKEGALSDKQLFLRKTIGY